jgi:hypothetical protein
MSIKKCNIMLVVRIKYGGKFPIVIPVNLAVLHETFEEACDWLSLWKVFFGSRKGYQLAGTATRWLVDLMASIRALGRYRLAEVVAREVKISINLW